jgi:hypothetical protein
MPPDAWFWSHDIRPEQVDTLAEPGWRPVRLSGYGHGERRRFAAVVYHEPGPARSARLDVSDLDGVAGVVALAAGDGPRFTALIDAGTRGRVVLDAVPPLAGVVDVAPYRVGGVVRLAAVIDPEAGSSWLVAGSARQLRAAARRLDASVVRLESTVDGEYAAIVEPGGTRTKWYVDLDADTVARRLDRRGAYPLDLRATRTDRGVRFSVVIGL